MRFSSLSRVTACLALGLALGGAKAAERPNIVLIMCDDMGWSDIGCYGGEVSTPSLDRLAAEGMRFTQFYNTGRCCPTRATLLSGTYAHQAGIGHMMGNRNLPGYKGDLNKNVRTIAEVMKTAGYATYMAGKWHVTPKIQPGGPRNNWPRQRGFDRFYGTIHGAGSFFDPNSLTRENTQVSPLTDEGYRPKGTYYYTDAISDHAARYIREHKSDKPFFIYVAYTAPHWPMHALEKDRAKYKGKYNAGWDAMRRVRYARQLKMGLIDRKWKMTERDRRAPKWEAAPNREWEIALMETYAAMVDRMDQAIGRVLVQLRTMDAFDNTLIFFLSDNGSSAEIMVRTDGHDPNAPPGSGPSYLCLGPGWSTICNTPFRRHKTWVHEGGCATPLIAHWPKGIKVRGELRRDPAHVIDVVPTILELAGVKRSPVGAPKAPGHSLLPAFAKDGSLRREYLWWLHEGNRAIRVGDWKLVAAKDDPWELYNLREDRTETNNLVSSNPGKVKELEHAWTKRMDEFRKLASQNTKP